MARIDRRQFLERSLYAAAAAAAAPLPLEASPGGRPAGPNEILRVAVVGVRGRGEGHVSAFAAMKDVHVAAICDVDESVIPGAMNRAEQGSGRKPVFYKDYRKLCEDKSIDAISVATCNHTHTLISITAALAGKHVYVEKPLSHNVWEGRRLVEAARKHGVVVQHGTQSRSEGRWRRAIAFLRSGKLGAVKTARGLCYKRRPSIGFKPDGPVPPGVDYDLWLGPAPERPFNPNRFHYNWHWFWDTGNGDLGNQGVHQMDIALWGLGKAELPKRVSSVGGRLGYKDQAETANTQVCWYDYGDAEIIFEVRGLDTEPFMGQRIGNIFHCEKGYLAGTTAFDLDGAKIPIETEDDGKGGNHFPVFVDAIRAGKKESPTADVLDGHLSSALCHLGNISYRLGQPRRLSEEAPFGEIASGQEAYRRMREHLRENGVGAETEFLAGRLLDFDPASETFKGCAEADRLLTREYRKPYVVPEKV
jgi:predicted dehydrogenase